MSLCNPQNFNRGDASFSTIGHHNPFAILIQHLACDGSSSSRHFQVRIRRLASQRGPNVRSPPGKRSGSIRPNRRAWGLGTLRRGRAPGAGKAAYLHGRTVSGQFGPELFCNRRVNRVGSFPGVVLPQTTGPTDAILLPYVSPSQESHCMQGQ